MCLTLWTDSNISMAGEDSEESRAHVGAVGVSHLSKDGSDFPAEVSHRLSDSLARSRGGSGDQDVVTPGFLFDVNSLPQVRDPGT